MSVRSIDEEHAAAGFAPTEAASLDTLFSLPAPAAQQLLCLHTFDDSMPAPGFSREHMAAATAICGGLPLTLQLLPQSAFHQQHPSLQHAAGRQASGPRAECVLQTHHVLDQSPQNLCAGSLPLSTWAVGGKAGDSVHRQTNMW